MKILIISTTKPYKDSGAGITEYTYQTIVHIKPLLSKNDSIKNIYAIPESKRNNITGLLYANTKFKNIISSIPNNKYDIIHITDHEIGFVAKILKKAGNKAKIITTIHDLSRFEKGLHRGLTQRVYNKFVKGSIKDAVKYSDFLLCNSTQTYQTVIERFGKIKNIKVVPHGTNDLIIKTQLLKKERKNGDFIIGYIGALMKHKNVIFILQTAKILKQKLNYKFIIYGTGVDKGILLKFKKNNNLNDVELKGHLKEEKKINTYNNFDIFIFPSLYEGLGYPILEAHASGLPVIIYKYGKIPKGVRKYCFEAESPEHMAQIIEDIKENGYDEKLQKKATEYARSFTWEKCARETLEVYNKMHNKNE